MKNWYYSSNRNWYYSFSEEESEDYSIHTIGKKESSPLILTTGKGVEIIEQPQLRLPNEYLDPNKYDNPIIEDITSYDSYSGWGFPTIFKAKLDTYKNSAKLRKIPVDQPVKVKYGDNVRYYMNLQWGVEKGRKARVQMKLYIYDKATKQVRAIQEALGSSYPTTFTTPCVYEERNWWFQTSAWPYTADYYKNGRDISYKVRVRVWLHKWWGWDRVVNKYYSGDRIEVLGQGSREELQNY